MTRGQIAALTIGFLALLIAMSIGGLAWRYYTADVRGVVDAEEQITRGTNRIQQYERFFDLCSQAQTMQSSIESQELLLEDADESERRRIRSNLAGMNAQLNRYVNQYNVNAAKDYTAARFQASNLPFNLNAEQPIVCSK